MLPASGAINNGFFLKKEVNTTWVIQPTRPSVARKFAVFMSASSTLRQFLNLDVQGGVIEFDAASQQKEYAEQRNRTIKGHDFHRPFLAKSIEMHEVRPGFCFGSVSQQNANQTTDGKCPLANQCSRQRQFAGESGIDPGVCGCDARVSRTSQTETDQRTARLIDATVNHPKFPI